MQLRELIDCLHHSASSNSPEFQTQETIISNADLKQQFMEAPMNQIFRHTWASYQKKSEHKEYQPIRHKAYLSKDDLDKIRMLRCTLES